MRFVTGSIIHEANTFFGLKTDLDHFIKGFQPPLLVEKLAERSPLYTDVKTENFKNLKLSRRSTCWRRTSL